LLVYTPAVIVLRGFRGLGLVVPVAACVAATLSFVATPRARAQAADAGAGSPDSAAVPARVHAQQLLAQGNELFRADRFADALTAYREAHRLFPSPKLLFNIALCEQSLGHRAQAMLNLFAFVKQAPDADAPFRAEAERRMAALAAALAAVDISALPPNAKIVVDAQAMGLTPLDRPLWLEPGVHRISVDRPGRPLWVTTLDGKAGALIALTMPPEVEAPPAPPGGDPGGPGPAPPGEPPPEASFLRRTWWIWAAAGLVVAGAATLVVIKLRECPASRCL